MPIRVIILIVLFVLLIVFAIGGVVWFFIQENLQTKRYIEFIDHIKE